MSNFSYGEYNRILGKKDAKIKIIMFSDYECMYCKRLWPYLVNLPAKYDVAVYDKHFVVHKKGMIVAEIYEAVRIATGKKLNGYLFKHRKFGNNESNGNIINEILKDNDLEKQSQRIRNLIKSKEVKRIIDKDISEGRKFNVSGTPTLFIDGYRVVGADRSSIETVLKHESR
ncbi:MAG: thioredoxin domain-containing protein [Epsilonproteobacteria bacterium]|nr:thioredoxin domain-containing protein [Campylobacterota bacterium]